MTGREARRTALSPLRLPEPILVVGGYGYRNVGDEAILAGLLATLGRRRVSVVSRSPAATVAMHAVRAVPVTSTVAELSRHRSVLIGGGGLFGRDMGRIGQMLPAYGLLAAAAGRTVVLHGVGVDRGLPRVTAAALRRLARHASQVTVRDPESAAVLGEWRIEAPVIADLSSGLEPTKPATAISTLRASGVDPRRPIVGLSLTAVNAELTDAVLEAVSSAMDALPDVQFAFVPMSQHPFVARHNDLLVAHRLQARQPRLRIVEGWSHPSEVLALFGQLDAVVGMRFHSLLFAERAQVPIIPIPYAAKVGSWLVEKGEVAVEPTAAALLERIGPLVSRKAAS
jgi:polysaccharide pyruvyl transferase WcaK-like protein